MASNVPNKTNAAAETNKELGNVGSAAKGAVALSKAAAKAAAQNYTGAVKDVLMNSEEIMQFLLPIIVVSVLIFAIITESLSGILSVVFSKIQIPAEQAIINDYKNFSTETRYNFFNNAYDYVAEQIKKDIASVAQSEKYYDTANLGAGIAQDFDSYVSEGKSNYNSYLMNGKYTLDYTKNTQSMLVTKDTNYSSSLLFGPCYQSNLSDSNNSQYDEWKDRLLVYTTNNTSDNVCYQIVYDNGTYTSSGINVYYLYYLYDLRYNSYEITNKIQPFYNAIDNIARFNPSTEEWKNAVKYAYDFCCGDSNIEGSFNLFKKGTDDLAGAYLYNYIDSKYISTLKKAIKEYNKLYYTESHESDDNGNITKVLVYDFPQNAFSKMQEDDYYTIGEETNIESDCKTIERNSFYEFLSSSDNYQKIFGYEVKEGVFQRNVDMNDIIPELSCTDSEGNYAGNATGGDKYSVFTIDISVKYASAEEIYSIFLGDIDNTPTFLEYFNLKESDSAEKISKNKIGIVEAAADYGETGSEILLDCGYDNYQTYEQVKLKVFYKIFDATSINNLLPFFCDVNAVKNIQLLSADGDETGADTYLITVAKDTPIYFDLTGNYGSDICALGSLTYKTKSQYDSINMCFEATDSMHPGTCKYGYNNYPYYHDSYMADTYYKGGTTLTCKYDEKVDYCFMDTINGYQYQILDVSSGGLKTRIIENSAAWNAVESDMITDIENSAYEQLLTENTTQSDGASTTFSQKVKDYLWNVKIRANLDDILKSYTIDSTKRHFLGCSSTYYDDAAYNEACNAVGNVPSECPDRNEYITSSFLIKVYKYDKTIDENGKINYNESMPVNSNITEIFDVGQSKYNGMLNCDNYYWPASFATSYDAINDKSSTFYNSLKIYKTQYYDVSEVPKWCMGAINPYAYSDNMAVYSASYGTVVQFNSYSGTVVIRSYDGTYFRYRNISSFDIKGDVRPDIYVGASVYAGMQIGIIYNAYSKNIPLIFDSWENAQTDTTTILLNDGKEFVIDNKIAADDVITRFYYDIFDSGKIEKLSY